MAEYIERGALLARLQENFNNRCNHDLLCKYVIDKIRTFPAADVEPVRHGKWISNFGMAPDSKCSECGSEYEWWEPSEAHYCPNCGAKMDRGEENA